jgi:iron(III) transport system substrate-binding protein
VTSLRRFWLPAFLVLLACRPTPPPLPEVRLHATVSEQGLRALGSLAEMRGLARVTRAAALEVAEIAWFGDPAEAVRSAELLAAGAAPDQPDVDARWKDAARRFAPLCARARVLVRNPAASLPLQPQALGDLADPRLAGRQALPPMASGLGPATAAALALLHGEEGARGFLDRLARNRPRITASDDEVRRLVASGAVAFGLTGSEEAAAGALSAAALEVVYPDQSGQGTVVLPTAVALLKAGSGSEAARRLMGWMAGPEAERLLVGRAPGYLPLRADVPVPLGVRPAVNLRSLPINWDRLAELERRLGPYLERWHSQ